MLLVLLRTLKWYVFYPLQVWKLRFLNRKSTILKISFAVNNWDIHFEKGVFISNYNIIHVISKNGMKGSLKIGENTYIGECNNLRAAGGPIEIGKNCMIAEFVTLVASNHKMNFGELMIEQDWDSTKCGIFIDDDVWIGANSVILPGVHIGKGCVIGAGSVVTKDVKPFSIVVGNPARILKKRDSIV